MKINANFHTHTTFCDGSDTPESVIKEAVRKGFTELGFSGHVDPGVSMDIPAYIREIKRLQEQYREDIDIIRGVELDNVYDPYAAEDTEYYIGSTHFVPVQGSDVWNRTVPYGTHRENQPDCDICGVDASVDLLHDHCRKYFHDDFYEMSERYYAFEALICDRMKPAFIGHFDLITRFNDLSKEDGGHFLDETSEKYLVPARKAMEKLAGYGIPFELNLGAVNRGRKKEAYPGTELLRYLRELGGEILISSDAHQKELLDGCFDEAIETAKGLGFRHVNILVREMKDSDDPELYREALNTRSDNGRRLFWKKLML
ncbi:histidinol-phosphatase HisJ family protein [Oribacterium sp. WCC10]|uniref:histidinol-phosphatase HisJ family protein n=1 Tax=Oribacterium sp. WCC10 TaxID=1855343 RepID=UPI0008E314A0|nr:histidinol-phosphatase HisJ family protein [Oribacterium sp. WCC10]SFG29653.1 histidinol-phosphatase (PHP family) [Oribacterium sp. WCC10]